jgi:hypothetical protein
MPHSNIITGTSEAEIWKTISEQLNTKEDKPYYTAQFETNKHTITIHVDLKHDTELEDGPITSFTAPLPDKTTFRFRIAKQNLKHSIGKLFGMQDLIVGHDEFDKKFLIQTNDETKLKELLSDAAISDALLKQPIIHFEIKEHKIGANRETVLDLEIEGGIINPAELEDIYQPFKTILNYLD